jgi:integrase
MARQQRDVRLQTREARRSLARRKEPYWHEFRRGLHIGYAKGSNGASWILKEERDGRRTKRRLGLADDETDADGIAVFSWPQVLKAALGEERPTLKPRKDYTVQEALEDYWPYRTAKSSTLSVSIDQAKIAAAVPPTLLLRPVALLETGELERWRNDLVAATSDPEAKRRSQATADRIRRVLFAALSFAHRARPHDVPSDAAWRAVRPFRETDRPRTRFLSVEEAKRLLSALPADFRALARGALYTGLRLGELLALRVCEVAGGQVQVRHSKSGKPRTVPLSTEGVEFFDQVTAGKPGEEIIFLQASGAPWKRLHASRHMARACAAAKITPPAVFHDLRRSYGSLLLNAGADVEVIQELLGHADLRMTRRAYAHLLNQTVTRVVKKRLPSFGLESKNVRKLKP